MVEWKTGMIISGVKKKGNDIEICEGDEERVRGVEDNRMGNRLRWVRK